MQRAKKKVQNRNISKKSSQIIINIIKDDYRDIITNRR